MNSMDSLEREGADRRLSSPSARRNREPILAVLRSALPQTGRVLEIASGSGEHAVHFARHLAPLCWQPSDPSETALASIAAWREAEALGNLAAPVCLDVTEQWPVLPDLVAIVCINLLHISPWDASEALFAEAGRRLPAGGVLVVYGPFRRHGKHTAPSNAAFDADLRSRDSRWGVRDLEAVEALAGDNGLRCEATHELPANNLCIVWRR
ncbi:DUF938 domain-containing protein [Salinicola sp. MIT1003]|uniref:DUF938 domain-containing protein n=1 Tax=Salinicola sp. MIT1003 TaxID=1882734 RepID=UPI0008DDE318|nr:DUF938 domain-containing protein [Salinicola sp. MIT1003]OHZ04088.1 SAM-dependent methyltransferase [Salinicola sp. MIT1003]